MSQAAGEPDNRPNGVGEVRKVIAAAAVIGILCLGVSLAFIIPAVTASRGEGKESRSATQLRVAALALLVYSEGAEGRFPLAENWSGAIEPLLPTPEVLISPFKNEAYAYFRGAAGSKPTEDSRSASRPLLFESRMVRSFPVGGRDDLSPREGARAVTWEGELADQAKALDWTD
jgi:hypothetical protein